MTYFYDKNIKVRTKTKIGMLVNTAPGFIGQVHYSKVKGQIKVTP